MNTKGLRFGSIFKITFLGFFAFFAVMMSLGLLLAVDDSASNGFTGLSTTMSHNINIENPLDGLSNTLIGFIVFLIVYPLMTLIMSLYVTFFTYIGQFIYTRLKPLELTFTDKGLDIFSTFKLYIVGSVFSWAPFGLFVVIIQTIFDEDSEGILELIGILIGSLIAFPLLSIITGGICAFFIYIGNRLFTLVKPIKLKYIE